VVGERVPGVVMGMVMMAARGTARRMAF